MGSNKFAIADDLAINNGSISTNGSHVVYSSPVQSNSVGLSSLECVVEYANVLPEFGAIPITYRIYAVVEGRNDSGNSQRWYPIAYQFEGFRRDDDGRQRVIRMQPNMNTFDSGIDDIVYVGGETIARISRQQGQLPEAWRVCVIVEEFDAGGAGAFQSANISIYGETFDV